MTAQTIADADDYWKRYYSGGFIPGLGTEQILAVLAQVPSAETWLDLGAGSESLLWSIPLDTRRLIAIDSDTQRLRLLRAYADKREPRPAYRTVLAMCGRDDSDFARRCGRLAGTVTADCLTGLQLPARPGSAGLVTQFGLLGLASDENQFLRAWDSCHVPLTSGGWAAGANWNITSPSSRIRLTEQLYQTAMSRSRISPILLTRVPTTSDPDFDSVWIYLGRTA